VEPRRLGKAAKRLSLPYIASFHPEPLTDADVNLSMVRLVPSAVAL
jgi:hypothetical protein